MVDEARFASEAAGTGIRDTGNLRYAQICEQGLNFFCDFLATAQEDRVGILGESDLGRRLPPQHAEDWHLPLSTSSLLRMP